MLYLLVKIINDIHGFVKLFAGSRPIRRLINYHKGQVTSLLAQEYLQKHLEVELNRLGAQFKQYDIKTKPFHEKDIKKFRERNINWVKASTSMLEFCF